MKPTLAIELLFEMIIATHLASQRFRPSSGIEFKIENRRVRVAPKLTLQGLPLKLLKSDQITSFASLPPLGVFIWVSAVNLISRLSIN